MKVVEKFVSINGEGTRAGELAVFVRFQGCALACSYCDTMWANQDGCPFTSMEPEEIVEYIHATGIFNVTLTGGEPLQQEDMPRLLALLSKEKKLRVEVETNGAVNLAPFCARSRPIFTMDYKLPDSGWEGSMDTANFSLLLPCDTVKFVCASRRDLERAGEIIKEYGLLNRCHVYLSPVFGRIEPVELVNFMLEQRLNGARLQIQIHKVIWDPNKRGV